MARIRSVKPEFWDDQELAERVSRDARLLYIGLWNLADEHGRLRGDVRFIRGRVFPYDDDLSIADVGELLNELAVVGKLVQYRTATGTYIYLPNLGKHQRLEPEKVASKLPHPDDPGVQILSPRAQSNPSGAQIGADEVARDLDENALLYVAGSMEHVSADAAPPHGSAHTVPGQSTARSNPKTGKLPSTAPKLSWNPKEIDADPKWQGFWHAYPKSADKGHARKTWLRVVEEHADDPDFPDRLISAAEEYRDDPRRTAQFTKNAGTWLNGECWDDAPAVESPGEEVPAGPRPFWEN